MLSRIRSKLLQPFSNYVTSHEVGDEIKKHKLVSTILVKNEIDIIELAIQHQLKSGVDYIIATDNMSTDGTFEVLQEYKRQGVLHLIQEKDQDYSQAKWVNRMGKIAFDSYDANFIMHTDADEFWHSEAGNLKYELVKYPLIDAIRVPIKNVLLAFDDFKESFPTDSKYIVEHPLISNNLESDSKINSMFLYEYEPNVLYKVKHKYREVSAGNHNLLNYKNFLIRKSSDISVYHFPIRSKKQFFDKVIQGGKAYERNLALNKSIGWHWRRWYEMHKNNSLEEEYLKLIISPENFPEWESKGVLVKVDSILNKISHANNAKEN